MTGSVMGKTGIEVSRLGFGCMRLPEIDGKIDRVKAGAMIDRAYAAGVNYFDTAYGYHDGDSEVFLSEALKKYPRDSYSLADKLPTWLLKTEEDVPRLLEEQLGRCGADYFDFYLLHALNGERMPAVRETKAYEQLLQKKRDGVIRALGFSYHGDYESFCEIVDGMDWDFAQIQINYLDYEMFGAGRFHDKLSAKGIPCVVMEPVRGGFLANLPREAAAELARAGGGSQASYALRWCMDMENMPLILSGMSTMEQVEENLATFSAHRPLSADENAAITRAREIIMSIKTVPCTACGYCMDCSSGVGIPDVFGVYNRYKLFGDAFGAVQEYGAVGGERNASNCTECGACSPMCPQGIEIPERLKEAHRVLTGLKV